MPSENVIRDRLSVSLHVLEEGLTLIDVNHKLPNAVGAKGFVDILARDRFGMFVIIELKRSDQSSREALFEILKYLPLFVRQHGVEPHRIRCFIVSTTWHELWVPFSEFRRQCPVSQTEGFRIEVDAAGDVTKAEKVADYPEDDVARVFRSHCVYLFDADTKRDAAVPLLRSSLDGSGATGYLLFRLDYRGRSPNVIYPFGAYVVPTRVEPAVLACLRAEAETDLGDDVSETELRHSVENRFLARVVEFRLDHFPFDCSYEGSTPDRFTHLVERDWRTLSVERVGPFASPLVLPDPDVIELVKGLSGDNSVRYERITSPTTARDWNDVRRTLPHFLLGNPVWQAGVEWFFDRVEREFPDATVYVQAYNPLTLPESLYHCAVRGTSEYVPMLTIAAIPKDAPQYVGLAGALVWDGKFVPSSVESVFRGLSEGVDDLSDYYFARMVGCWELDEELMRRHGLQYSLCFLTYAGADDKGVTGLQLTKGGIEELPSPLHPSTLGSYFDAARPYLEELFTQIDSTIARAS